MPHLTDKSEIRTRLRRDPAWSVYALGDLAPRTFPKTSMVPAGPHARRAGLRYGILFAMGRGSVREALDWVAWPVHLQVQRDAFDEVARHATVSSPRLMWRMAWTGNLSRPRRAPSRATFPQPPGRTYWLARRGPRELAMSTLGATAVGGDSHDYEGGTRRASGVETIGLNVGADNDTALHLYESLGLERHCEFYGREQRPEISTTHGGNREPNFRELEPARRVVAAG